MIIVDAGGGTIDVSAYHKTAELSFEEIAPAECKSTYISLCINYHERHY